MTVTCTSWLPVLHSWITSPFAGMHKCLLVIYADLTQSDGKERGNATDATESSEVVKAALKVKVLVQEYQWNAVVCL